MSLIQEALKRQQEDSDAGKNSVKAGVALSTPPAIGMDKAEVKDGPKTKEILPGISAIPPVPLGMASSKPAVADNKQEVAHTSAPAQEEKPAKEKAASRPPTQTPILESSKKPKKKNNSLLVGILILIIVFVGIKIINKPADETAGSEVASEDVSMSTDDTTIVEDNVTEESPEPVIIQTETAPEPEESDVENANTSVVPSAPPAVVKIEWPALTLTAVMGNGKKGSAMINGQLISIGDQIEGVEFVGVGKNGIYVQYKGVSRFLKRGQTTY